MWPDLSAALFATASLSIGARFVPSESAALDFASLGPFGSSLVSAATAPLSSSSTFVSSSLHAVTRSTAQLRHAIEYLILSIPCSRRWHVRPSEPLKARGRHSMHLRFRFALTRRADLQSYQYPEQHETAHARRDG
jgi:hypothetical protein